MERVEQVIWSLESRSPVSRAFVWLVPPTPVCQSFVFNAFAGKSRQIFGYKGVTSKDIPRNGYRLKPGYPHPLFANLLFSMRLQESPARSLDTKGLDIEISPGRKRGPYFQSSKLERVDVGFGGEWIWFVVRELGGKGGVWGVDRESQRQ